MSEINWRIWVHSEIDTMKRWPEAGHATGAQFIWKIATLLVGPEGRVRQTYTNKLKPMKGDIWGSTRRFRDKPKGVRVLFDITSGPGDQKSLWIHDIFIKSDTAYKEHQPRSTTWAKSAVQDVLEDWQAARESPTYKLWRAENPVMVQGDVDARRVEDWELDENQQQIVKNIYPLARDTAVDDFWIQLVSGAPGAGKTVVAQRAVCEAVGNNEGTTDILILVPTVRLKRSYREDIEAEVRSYGMAFGEDLGLHISSYAQATEGPNTAKQPPVNVWVNTFEDAFGRTDISELERWWAETKTEVRKAPGPGRPILNQTNTAGRTRRFLRLLDSAFSDGIATPDYARDALLSQDADLLAALRCAEGNGDPNAWPAPLFASVLTGERLMWQRARRFGKAVETTRPDRDLLVIVDEAQDLAPTAWQALIQAIRNRRDSGPRLAGIALLGDENQRIAPTSFSWRWVREWCRDTVLDHNRNLPVHEMRGSYRSPRSIARIAAPIMRSARFRLPREPAPRQAPVVNWTKLPHDKLGQVLLYACQPPETADQVLSALAQYIQAAGVEERIVVLAEPSETDSTVNPYFDQLDIIQAKGSEWESVILKGVFPKQQRNFDERCRAYTRLTRAQKSVLVILESHEHDRVALEQWRVIQKATGSEEEREVGQRIQVLETISEVANRLLQDGTFAQAQSLEQLEGRLHQVLEDARTNDADHMPPAAIDLLRRVAEQKGSHRIPGLMEDYLAARPEWLQDLRSSDQMQDDLGKIITHLADGQIVEAWQLADTMQVEAVLESLRAVARDNVADGSVIAFAQQEAIRQTADLVSQQVMDARAYIEDGVRPRPFPRGQLTRDRFHDEVNRAARLLKTQLVAALELELEATSQMLEAAWSADSNASLRALLDRAAALSDSHPPASPGGDE